MIKEGYITHPTPLSPPADTLSWKRSSHVIPQEVQALLKTIRLEQSKEVALRTFHELAKQPLLKDLRDRITYKPLQAIAEDVQQSLTDTLAELGKALANPSVGRLQTLFYAKALETLLWGDGYSVMRLEERSAALSSYEQKLAGEQATLAEESLIEPLMPETSAAWIDFLVAVENNHPQTDKEKLQALLHSIGNARSIWLTFFFDPARKKANSSEELLAALLEQFDPASQAFVAELRNQEKLIDRFKTDLFADPAAYHYAFNQLKTIVQQFQDHKMLEAFQKSSPMAKVIAVKILCKVVTLYDCSVKSLKAPQLQTKAQHFQEMLQPYFSLFNTVVLKLVGDGRFYLQDMNLDTYLENIEKILTQKLDFSSSEKLGAALRPSPRFSVLAAMLGSGTSFRRHLPSSLEDVFTLIHQNLTACTSYILQSNLSLKDITRPPLFEESLLLLKKTFGENTSLIGIEQTQGKLILQYNAPLRNHSSTFQLTFKEGKLFISVQFLGQARSRWGEISYYLQMLDTLGLRPLTKKPYQHGDVLSFCWGFESEEGLANGLEIIQRIYKWTIELDAGNFCDDIWGLVQNDKDAPQEIAFASEKYIASNEPALRRGGLQMLSLLVEKGFPFTAPLLRGILSLSGDTNQQVQTSALPLLRSTDVWDRLQEQDGEAAEKIALAAEEYIVSNDPTTRSGGLKLLKILVDKGLPYTENLMKGVISLSFDSDPQLQKYALRLLTQYVEKGYLYDEALEIARENIGNPRTRMDALNLIKILLFKEFELPKIASILSTLQNSEEVKPFDHIAAVLEQLVSLDDPLTQKWGLERLSQLVHTGHPYTEHLFRAISLLSQDSDLTLRKYSLEVLKGHVQKGQFYKQSLSLATAMFNDAAIPQIDLYAILEKLTFEKYEEEFIASLLVEQCKEPSVNNSARNLLTTLVEKGFVREQAYVLALKALEGDFDDYINFAGGILTALVNQGFEVGAIACATEKFATELQADIFRCLLNALTKQLSSEESVNLFGRLIITQGIENLSEDFYHFSRSLVDQGKACDAIAVWAEHMLDCESIPFPLPRHGSNLLQEMAKQGRAPDTIKGIAERLKSDAKKAKLDLGNRLSHYLTKQ